MTSRRDVVNVTKPESRNPQISLADKIYSVLKEEINTFAIIPGDRMSEVEIGKRFGVSRTPVRQALYRLRDDGLIEVEPKFGWYVKPLDFDKLDDLYDLRIILEIASATRLCNMDTAEFSSLDALRKTWLIPPSEQLSDPRMVGALDEIFHSSLVQAAGNAELAKVHQDITERIRIVRRLDFTRPDRITITYAEHAEILRAIIQHKTSQAELLIRAHIEQSKIEVRKITLNTLYEVRSMRR